MGIETSNLRRWGIRKVIGTVKDTTIFHLPLFVGTVMGTKILKASVAISKKIFVSANYFCEFKILHIYSPKHANVHIHHLPLKPSALCERKIVELILLVVRFCTRRKVTSQI